MEIKVYVTSTCPYCHAAKALLEKKGLSYETIDVTGDDDARQKLVEAAGGRTTVPQIFIDGKSIGGYQELAQMAENGKL
ncbi:MAG: glutaredoxin 3 [Candidatus Omnitrophica bacterium]|nr:glutaredoxin 3 [Candidatus Omnitrophota bacterium]